MTERLKILVCGDVDGKFKTLFSRVDSIVKKNGPFDFLLCVGDFFGSSQEAWEPYRRGDISVPVLTYVLGPNIDEHVPCYSNIKGCELGPNVSYIGKRGVFTALSGLKLAYISGVESLQDMEQNHTFIKNDVTTVRDVCLRGQANFKGIDILATSSWPRGITTLDRRQGMREPSGSSLLSWLSAQIKPRYHFCGREGIFYERKPYSNWPVNDGLPAHATRFIALARVGNAAKDKWIYALSIDPIDKMKENVLYQQTTDQTPCPYSKDMLLQGSKMTSQEKPVQFFYDVNARDDEKGRKRHSRDDNYKSKKKPPPVFDQASCWFCLASPDVEKHLVISIGEHAYLALAKGPLVPDHVLILPVGHHQSLSCVPDDVKKEIKQFKSSLKQFYAKKKKVPVFFERNYRTSHLQIQVIAVSADLSSLLRSTFEDMAEAEGFHLDELPKHAKLHQIAPPGTPYFYVELPTGIKLFHRIQKKFPLQFGRDVLACESILNVGDRADWKECKMTKEEEMHLAENFRKSFEEFDFTLE